MTNKVPAAALLYTHNALVSGKVIPVNVFARRVQLSSRTLYEGSLLFPWSLSIATILTDSEQSIRDWAARLLD